MYLDPWVAEKINSHTSTGAENVQVFRGGHEKRHGDENGPVHENRLKHGYVQDQEHVNGLEQEHFNSGSLTREALDTYSENKRVVLLAFLMEKSPFYKQLLKGIIDSIGWTMDASGSINSARAINSREDMVADEIMDAVQLLDIARSLTSKWELIPFTCPQDIILQGEQMICVHPSEISRIVSQTTSGTTGPSKRIYFTPQDQELTLDYFHYGMKVMVAPGDKVLILLPHKSIGSLGFLLQESLFRLGAEGFFEESLETLGEGFSIEGEAQNRLKKLGYVSDIGKIDLLKVKEITAIVGPPSLIVTMTKTYPSIRPHSILMTADFVAAEDRKAVKDTWGSRVFEHYGMTEMGLGCAMSCRDTEENMPVGYHIRENDLYIEIVDPLSTKILPQGEWGEIVVTTLTRKGMPLLRYRTGDTGRFLKEPCSCGSVLKRLDRVQKRSQSKNINE